MAVVAVLACLTSTACSGASAEPAETSAAGSASASASKATSTVKQQVLSLTSATVGTVRIGADRTTTEAQLTDLLGPFTVIGSGQPYCSLFPDEGLGRFLAFGDLTVVLTTKTPKDTTYRLTGWTLNSTRTPLRPVLPHNTTLGVTTGRQLLAADKRATSSSSLDPNRLQITDGDQVVFYLSGPSDANTVETASFGVPPCE
jgi:hypothetical protein